MTGTVGGDVCRNCSRLAGPAPAKYQSEIMPAGPAPDPVLVSAELITSSVTRTPEEIRASVLEELTAMAEGMMTAEEFWEKYVLVDDIALICGAHKKNFRSFLSLSEIPLRAPEKPGIREVGSLPANRDC